MTIKEDEILNQWYVVLYFYIPKKDGLLWLVQDYKKLNQHTIKDKMLLLLIGEVIDKLKEAKYFNKLDLIWGYNNIWIKKGDKWKAVFLKNKGLFKPKSNVFWTIQLTRNIPKNDEQHFLRVIT